MNPHTRSIALCFAVASAIPVAAAADSTRLQARGLNPSSATFLADVRSRLAASRKLLSTVPVVPIRRILPPANAKFSPESITRFTPNATALKTTTTLKTTTPITTAASSKNLTTRINPATIAGLLSNSFGYEQLDDFLSGNPIDTSAPLPIPGDYILVVDSSQQHLLEPGYATYTMSIPACKVTITNSLARLWDPTIQPADDNYYGWKRPASPSGKYQYDLNLWAASYPQSVPFAIGAGPQLMTLTYPSDGESLTHSFTVINAEKDASTFNVSIDEYGRMIDSGGLELSGDSIAAGQPGVTRINQGSTAITGSDIIGRGVSLGAGYTATAKVIVATSIADAPGNIEPDNAYRGATVVTQPQAGRLESVVNWHVGPYDSLQYVVQYTLTGPPGQRPVSSMPLTGPCDS